MSRLSLLGEASIEGADGPVYGRGAQRRRIALLAILALARRAVSRDKVIGLLWADHPADRARKLLSESLYVLRRALGEDAITTSGDDLRLDPAVVACDAILFEDAVAADELEAAVALYRGPLLDGFYLSDASEFEHWLDGERDRLARLYTDVLLRLARAAEARSDTDAATAAWRRLCQTDPYNAVYALEMMRMLDRAGDRAGALAHARVHTALMREEFGAAPDPAITALVAQLRASPETRAPSTSPAWAQAAAEEAEALPYVTAPAEPSSARVGVLEAPQPVAMHTASATVAGGPLPRGRRLPPAARAVAAALLLLALVSGFFTWRAQSDFAAEQAAAAPQVIRVVVVPFTVEGGEDLQYLSVGAARLLSNALDGAGAIRTVDHHAVLRELEGPLSPQEAARTAQRMNARWFVLGSIVQVGAEVQITADIHDGAARVLHTATVTGPVEAMSNHFDAIARALIGHVTGGSAVRRHAIHNMPIGAVKDYLAGDSAFRAGHYAAAVDALQRAVAAHPDNALAHYLLSAAAEWSFDFLLARTAAAQARARTERLPPRHAELVYAWHDFLSGQAESAERRYEALLANDPGDVEAWAGLAEVMMHYNPVRGRSQLEAVQPLQRVLAADSSYGEVRFHVLELAAAARDSAVFRRMYRQLDRQSPQYPAWRAVDAFVWGTPREQEGVLTALLAHDELAIGIAAGRLAAHAHEYGAAARVAGLLIEPGRTSDWRAAGHLFRAQLALATDSLQRALQHLDSAAAIEPAWSLELRALAALHPANTSADVVADTRARVERWDPAARTPRFSFFLGAHADVHKLLRPYLLSLLSARLGDIDAAQQWQQALARSGTRVHEAFAYALSTSARARIALLRADSAQAIELLLQSAGPVQSEPERIATSPFFSHALDRLLLADLLARRGPADDARRWYHTLTEGYDFAFATVARQRLAQLGGAH